MQDGHYQAPVPTIDNLRANYLRRVNEHPGSSWHTSPLHPKDLMPDYDDLPKEARTALDDAYFHSVVGHSLF